MENVEAKTVHLFSCGCGTTIQIPKGRIGVPVECSTCGREHEIGSLRELNSLPQIVLTPDKSPVFSFSILRLIQLTTLMAVVCTIGLRAPALTMRLVAFSIYLLIASIIGVGLLKIPSLVRAFWDKSNKIA